MFSPLILTALLAPAADAAPLATIALRDAAGKEHSAAEWKGKKAVVLLFISPDCPVSNFYCPEYIRLVKAFTDKGVLFYGVHPDPTVSAADAGKHAKEYGLPFPVLMDPAHAAARPAGVKVTPEAVVLSPAGRVLYRGRIDDRYTADGVRREEPTTRDLEAAISAVVAGKKPPTAETAAYGCPLPEPAKPNKK